MLTSQSSSAPSEKRRYSERLSSSFRPSPTPATQPPASVLSGTPSAAADFSSSRSFAAADKMSAKVFSPLSAAISAPSLPSTVGRRRPSHSSNLSRRRISSLRLNGPFDQTFFRSSSRRSQGCSAFRVGPLSFEAAEITSWPSNLFLIRISSRPVCKDGATCFAQNWLSAEAPLLLAGFEEEMARAAAAVSWR